MRKKLGFLAVMVLVIGAGAYVAADDFGDDGASNINVISDPPGGSDCNCPAVWDPVVCRRKNPDGSISRAAFSNGCVASCNGYTNCAQISIQLSTGS